MIRGGGGGGRSRAQGGFQRRERRIALPKGMQRGGGSGMYKRSAGRLGKRKWFEQMGKCGSPFGGLPYNMRKKRGTGGSCFSVLVESRG